MRLPINGQAYGTEPYGRETELRNDSGSKYFRFRRPAVDRRFVVRCPCMYGCGNQRWSQINAAGSAWLCPLSVRVRRRAGIQSRKAADRQR